MNYIDEIIDEKMSKIKAGNSEYELGYVKAVKSYMIEVYGLNNVTFFEEVEILGKARGYVDRINQNSVTIALIEINEPINIGDQVYATKKEFSAKFSNSYLGHVVNIFGKDLIENKYFDDLESIPIDTPPIPILERAEVKRPLITGITGIDLLYPIGRGQRELIIGDKKTGKTQMALDIIANQTDMISIYIAVGKTKKEVKELYTELRKQGVMDNTIILAAFTDECAPVLKNTPNTGLSIAEKYMREGKDVLVVIDDLKRHADIYREISILSGKTPGRDAYPPDIFYTHAKILEKGGDFINGGSITILPICETKGGDITDYISTNIISITDGQLVLSTKNFERGVKPAINYGLSVSRLGGAVQQKALKKIGAKTRQEYLTYLEQKEIYELTNTEDLSPTLREKIRVGGAIEEGLIQYKFSPRKESDILSYFSELVGDK